MEEPNGTKGWMDNSLSDISGGLPETDGLMFDDDSEP